MKSIITLSLVVLILASGCLDTNGTDQDQINETVSINNMAVPSIVLEKYQELEQDYDPDSPGCYMCEGAKIFHCTKDSQVVYHVFGKSVKRQRSYYFDQRGNAIDSNSIELDEYNCIKLMESQLGPNRYSIVEGVSEKEHLSESGLHLSFYHDLETCSLAGCYDLYHQSRTDNSNIGIYINNTEWKILDLIPPSENQTEQLVIGKESHGAVLKLCTINESVEYRDKYTNGTIKLGDSSYFFCGLGRGNAKFCDISSYSPPCNSSTSINLQTRHIHDVGSAKVRVWYAIIGYAYSYSFTEVSVLSDIVNLTEPQNNVILHWTNTTSSSNPKLTSIVIPRDSPIFEKLISGG